MKKKMGRQPTLSTGIKDTKSSPADPPTVPKGGKRGEKNGRMAHAWHLRGGEEPKRGKMGTRSACCPFSCVDSNDVDTIAQGRLICETGEGGGEEEDEEEAVAAVAAVGLEGLDMQREQVSALPRL